MPEKVWMEHRRDSSALIFSMPVLGRAVAAGRPYIFGEWNNSGELMGLAPIAAAGDKRCTGDRPPMNCVCRFGRRNSTSLCPGHGRMGNHPVMPTGRTLPAVQETRQGCCLARASGCARQGAKSLHRRGVARTACTAGSRSSPDLKTSDSPVGGGPMTGIAIGGAATCQLEVLKQPRSL